MGYTPPQGNQVNFVMGGSYTPPQGNQVNFIMGVGTYSKVVNLTAIFQKLFANNVNTSLDGYLFEQGSLVTSIGSQLLQENFINTSFDGIFLLRDINVSLNLDAYLYRPSATYFQSTNITAIVQKALNTQGVDIHALFGKTIPVQLSVNSLLRVLFSNTFGLDGYLSQSDKNISVVLNAQKIKSEDMSFSIDSLLQLLGVSSSTSVDSILLQHRDISVYLNALLVGSISTYYKEVDIDAILVNSGVTFSFSLDSFLSGISSTLVNMSSVLNKEMTSSLFLHSILKDVFGTLTNVSSVLIKNGNVVSDLDFVPLKCGILSQVSLGAVIKEGSFSGFVSELAKLRVRSAWRIR